MAWVSGPLPWADGNTSPTRKREVGTIPRLRVGLVLKPLVQLLAAISSGQPWAVSLTSAIVALGSRSVKHGLH